MLALRKQFERRESKKGYRSDRAVALTGLQLHCYLVFMYVFKEN